MNDPQVDLSMLKYLRRHSVSLRGHYEVTSGLIQNAPIELKFDMNDPFGILHIQNYARGQSQTVMRSLLVLQHILTCHQKADVDISSACIPVSACRRGF